MKNESSYVKKFASAYRKAVADCPDTEPPRRDPITQLLVGFLEWNATAKQAATAQEKLAECMVDHNDLRVSHPHEVVAVIGERYPAAEQRTARLREGLQEIYNREHGMSLDALTGKPKKQVRAYFDTLPGIVPYVAAQVSLLCFGVHAVPVDDHLLDRLKQEKAIAEDATVEQAESFLDRQIKAGDAVTAHMALRHWCDHTAATPAKSAAKTTTKKTTRKKAPAARVAKKK